ncbi:hypothetical protein [Legionella gresilensis]|nr:hypothetical protein [Legionella gresilensis]
MSIMYILRRLIYSLSHLQFFPLHSIVSSITTTITTTSTTSA